MIIAILKIAIVYVFVKKVVVKLEHLELSQLIHCSPTLIGSINAYCLLSFSDLISISNLFEIFQIRRLHRFVYLVLIACKDCVYVTRDISIIFPQKLFAFSLAVSPTMRLFRFLSACLRASALPETTQTACLACTRETG